ncbi:Ubiquitin carboxyl-terminal hydrolase 30 [Camponotus floridanus]|uniref:ubiquitinyl hydrolase 1 n=2 Tax=Camponotus floridanus TaxID=104421 RepID=E1ZW02_CAMFO|nr:Ubiquitin carboxyl-terminal hydrolase 30 [Camponotus floridanus]
MFAGVGFAIAVGLFVLWGPSPKPRKKGQVVGINNFGYTCFLNSLLQALAACPTFILWLQREQEKKRNFADTLLSILKKINGFAEDLYGDVTPVEIISSIGSLWNFGPGHQDVHELFHVVLSALDAEMQPANRIGSLSDALPPSPNTELNMRKVTDSPEAQVLNLRSASCNDIASVKNGTDTSKGFDKNCNNQMMTSTSSISSMSPSIGCKPGMILARSSELLSRSIQSNGDCKSPFRSWKSLCTMPFINIPSVSIETHPFSGLITSQIQCNSCFWKSSVRYDKLETLSLPLPPFSILRQYHTLEWLLSRFVDSEMIRDVQCDGCSLRCPAVKTLTLGKLPKCLCLHIPRTTWSPSGVLIKRDDHITFPELLVLDPYTYTETKKRNAQGDAVKFLDSSLTTIQGKHKYRLCAVIEHRGPVDSGHFVCFRRGNKTDQWLYTSDIVVESVSLTQVLLASPYLLFYERISSGVCPS